MGLVFSTDIVFKGSLLFGTFTQSCDKREVMLGAVQQYPTLLCTVKSGNFVTEHNFVTTAYTFWLSLVRLLLIISNFY